MWVDGTNARRADEMWILSVLLPGGQHGIAMQSDIQCDTVACVICPIVMRPSVKCYLVYECRIMWSQSTIMHLHLNWHDTAMLIWKLELNENTNHCVAQVQLIQYGSGYTCLSMKPFHLTYNYKNACQALFVMMQCFLVPNRGLQIILSYIFH